MIRRDYCVALVAAGFIVTTAQAALAQEAQGPGEVAGGVIGFLFMLGIFGTDIWVIVDASNLETRARAAGMLPTGPAGRAKNIHVGSMAPWGWLLACILLWIVAFPWYLIARNRFKIELAQFASSYRPVRSYTADELRPDTTDNLRPGQAYVQKMRRQGRTDAQIYSALQQAGWTPKQIEALLR